jgi:hypothetical protein
VELQHAAGASSTKFAILYASSLYASSAGAATMTETDLRHQLIRNIADLALVRKQREPLYDTQTASLSEGSAAAKLGAG